MRHPVALVALLTALCAAACGSEPLTSEDLRALRAAQCAADAYRDAGTDGSIARVTECSIVCADGWATCPRAAACTTRVHTDTDCAGCGDRCLEGFACRSGMLPSGISWACARVAVTR